MAPTYDSIRPRRVQFSPSYKYNFTQIERLCTALMATEARQEAQAEKLTLLVAKNTTGYFGARLNKPGRPKPYQARVRSGGKNLYLGSFATAEEAALCVARSPEGQAEAAKRAEAAAPLTIEVARQQAQAEKLTLLVVFLLL